jgi:hypothetical protein
MEFNVNRSRTACLGLLRLAVAITAVSLAPVTQQELRPNILVIIDDDVGWINIDVCCQGRMAGNASIPGRLAFLNNGVMS